MIFWILSGVWTVIVIGSHYFDPRILGSIGSSEVAYPYAIGLPVYFVGLVVPYLLCGINIIDQWNRRPVLLFGKYVDTKGPGFCWVDPAFHTMLEDVLVNDEVQPLVVENVQTHDNVPIAFSVVLTSRVVNAEKFTVEVDDGDDALQQRALATVTECVGNTELDKILHDRSTLNEKIKSELQNRVTKWGIEVGAVELKDINITDEAIERAIAGKAKATKEAEAELARADMQLKIAQKLKLAVDTFDENTWRLKGMENILELCRSANNNTVIIPTELAQVFAQFTGAKKSNKFEDFIVLYTERSQTLTSNSRGSFFLYKN